MKNGKKHWKLIENGIQYHCAMKTERSRIYAVITEIRTKLQMNGM